MERLEEVLRSARKEAEQAEVFSVSSRATPIQFEANELTGSDQGEQQYRPANFQGG